MEPRRRTGNALAFFDLAWHVDILVKIGYVRRLVEARLVPYFAVGLLVRKRRLLLLCIPPAGTSKGKD